MTGRTGPEQPPRVRADRIDSGVRLGVAGAQVVDVTGLTRREAEMITGLGTLTREQWATAHSSRPASDRWPAVVDALGRAADTVLQGPAGAAGGEPLVAITAAPQLVAAVRAALPDSVRLISDPLLIEDLCRSAATRPGVVVLGASRAVAPHRYRRCQRLGVPHLPVVAGPHRIQVGPLVTGAGPCLRCLDLFRTDRDRCWPDILAAAGDPEPHDADDPLPAGLLATASGVLALLLRGALTGSDPPPGLSVAVSECGPWILYHQWEPHPACGCAAPVGRQGRGREEPLAG